MAFKSFSQYQADKNGDFFVLPNHLDSAQVVFLYRSIEDVLVADVHYINTSAYKGYVHCCGDRRCPACNYGQRGIRKDTKLFIPLYNVDKDKIEFWDRSTFFETVLHEKVFSRFPNPSEAVWKVTRQGQANSRDTRYEIEPFLRNNSLPYDAILSKFGITFPEGYSTICKEMTPSELDAALNSSTYTADLPNYEYTPVPRGEASSPMPVVPTVQYSAPPEVAPPTLPEYNFESSSSAAPLPEFNPNTAVDGSQLSGSNQSVPGDDSTDSLDDVKF